jgi:general secretion pathway protein K
VPRSSRHGDAGRSGGFALIIVLWTLVLIAFIAAHLVSSGRLETRIAGNLVANAVTEAAADGAVYQAIFNLLDPRPEVRWPIDGAARELAIGDCTVGVALSDEAGRINPNTASTALLEALLGTVGSDPANARRIAAAIGDWVGSTRLPNGAEVADPAYRAAGLDYGPPFGPLETLDELQRVLGMTPGVFAAIRPHLSLFAPAEPNPVQAGPVVAAALATAGRAGPGAARTPQRPADVTTVRIAVAATGGTRGARATRTAIVRIASHARQYTILAWQQDAD